MSPASVWTDENTDGAGGPHEILLQWMMKTTMRHALISEQDPARLRDCTVKTRFRSPLDLSFSPVWRSMDLDPSLSACPLRGLKRSHSPTLLQATGYSHRYRHKCIANLCLRSLVSPCFCLLARLQFGITAGITQISLSVDKATLGFSHLFDASAPPALQIPALYSLLYFMEVLEGCTVLFWPISPMER